MSPEKQESLRRPRAFVVATLALLAAGILLSLLIGGRKAEVLFGALSMLFPVALMVLGALSHKQTKRLGRWPWGTSAFVALAVLLEGGYLGMLALAGRVLETAWFAGFPAATALFLGSLWLAPLVLVSLAYALTFDAHGVDEQDLVRLREFREEPTREAQVDMSFPRS